MSTAHEYAVVDQIKAAYGFDPRTLYCLTTGKPIGESWEARELIACLPGTPEEIADDLALRVLASMRPSMIWNRQRTETLTEMRVKAPVETLAYLLNRLIQPTKDQRDVGFVTLHSGRIRLYSRLARLDHTSDSFQNLLLWLLEVEAKLGLLTEPTPISLDSLLSASDLLGLLASTLEPWHKRRVEYHRNQEAEAKFFAMNPGAKRAWFDQWFDHAPKTETQLKRQEKTQTDNLLGAILAELLEPEKAAAKPSAMRPDMNQPTTAKPIPNKGKMPLRFGIKKEQG